jgi:hypothetical protein
MAVAVGQRLGAQRQASTNSGPGRIANPQLISKYLTPSSLFRGTHLTVMLGFPYELIDECYTGFLFVAFLPACRHTCEIRCVITVKAERRGIIARPPRVHECTLP